ncbi:MAG: hypothetical protein U0892_16275 [Pirellulales bacterium]
MWSTLLPGVDESKPKPSMVIVVALAASWLSSRSTGMTLAAPVAVPTVFEV